MFSWQFVESPGARLLGLLATFRGRWWVGAGRLARVERWR
jgi:hypothetical protein